MRACDKMSITECENVRFWKIPSAGIHLVNRELHRHLWFPPSHPLQIIFTMAFVLRRPLALSTALKQIPNPSSAAPIRAFHNSPIRSKDTFTSAFTKSRASFQNAFRRNYMQQPYRVARPDTGNLKQKLLVGAGLVGATLVATNLLFNRETREDGGMPPFERKYLNETFLHTGLGIGIIGVAARALHQSGWSYRLMATNPWMVIGISLAASIGTMYGTFATSPDK